MMILASVGRSMVESSGATLLSDGLYRLMTSEYSSSVTLGAEGVLPGGYIECFLRVFKQFTHTLPRGQMVGKFSMYSPL